MDPVEIEYLKWDPTGSPVSIHMNPGVVDGIAHDVIESFGTPSRPGPEVGGLLLGRVVAGPRPAVWVDRYQRISCEHHLGPGFILDNGEIAALEASAANILATGELAVVGLYRSHTRPGLQLEEADFDLIRRYFSDPSDLILLIKPETASRIVGQFHAWDKGTGAHPVSGEFPFRGHILKGEPEKGELEKDVPDVPAIPPVSESPRELPRENPRRLVPDFAPSPIEPPPSLYGLGQDSGPEPSGRPEELTVERGSRLKKWLPLLAAMVLVGGVLWFVVQPGGHGSSSPAPAQTAEPERPLGLYVDPAGQTWRVSWNPNATALHEARSVQLFVREGDEQKRFDLSTRDLASGSYQYSPVANDVTFRLEVVDKAGRVSAESFRLMRSANPQAPAPAPPAVPSPAGGTARITQPKPIYKAPPVIEAGIRSRIKGTISIDVRVQIDVRGHVVSATPVTRQRSGLDRYLAGRAVQAARLWRFEPARMNGKAVAGTQIINFVFDK
jgi:hypothetical protein